MKSGIGSATVALEGSLAGVRVSALVAVNAVGDVRDPQTGALIAGARQVAGEHGTRRYRSADEARPAGGFRRENTTLVVVATNARLTKVQATKLAQLAGLGVARTIYPVNTMSDGDIVIALSMGNAGRERRCAGSGRRGSGGAGDRAGGEARADAWAACRDWLAWCGSAHQPTRRSPLTESKCRSRLRRGSECCRQSAAIHMSFEGIGVPRRLNLQPDFGVLGGRFGVDSRARGRSAARP